MLEVLCGNKSVQKILLFLFVNGKCYGTQLQHALQTSLTPLQKALQRLESGGLLTSYYEGKTRIYQFDPSYPLLHEMEQLLKKAYTLLPPHEKKNYYVSKQNAIPLVVDQKKKLKTLLSCWEKLKNIDSLSFHAKTKSKEQKGWNGKGEGEVRVVRSNDNILLFHEEGSWKDERGAEFNFNNVFRWTLDCQAGVIGLEHLRRGLDRPVFLFYLAPADDRSLVSVDSHLCAGDTYLGQIHFDARQLRLNWRVIGPKKNEEIDYYYQI